MRAPQSSLKAPNSGPSRSCLPWSRLTQDSGRCGSRRDPDPLPSLTFHELRGRWQSGVTSCVVISENCCERLGSSSVSQAASPARRCISLLEHLAREKSLVPKCSEIKGNSPHISKGVFANDICEFESSEPSQPVRSLWAMSGLQKYVRHSRELARRHV